MYHYCHVLFSSYFHVTFINALELTWSELVLAVPFFNCYFGLPLSCLVIDTCQVCNLCLTNMSLVSSSIV